MTVTEQIERAQLLGRGGAAFPTANKWRAVASRSRGDAVIVINGAECEPRSLKDRLVMTTKPDLVLDGAFAAARELRANRVILYLGERHEQARDAMLRAVSKRPDRERRLVTLSLAPARYVAGAEAAAIHFINEGIATPINLPPYPFERGVGGEPTLVQNVETLMRAGLIARGLPLGGTLITLAGSVVQPGVMEVEPQTTIGEAIASAGGMSEAPRAILVGGYFGRWLDMQEALALPLAHGQGLGCGVIGVLAASRCPVCDVAGIMRYLAAESSAQCGPCFFGLRALADACTRIATDRPQPDDLTRLHRWAGEVRGRGACKHPDGAAIFLSSALEVFGREFASHEHTRNLRQTA
jgi:NADH:ubiquinone oxidoreductase subunit F (NADH-binding)